RSGRGCRASIRGAQVEVWRTRLATEQGNLRAALRWLTDAGRVEQSQRLGGALATFWLLRGSHLEGRAWLNELRALDTGTSHGEVHAKLLNGMGLLASAQGDGAAARAELWWYGHDVTARAVAE